MKMENELYSSVSDVNTMGFVLFYFIGLIVVYFLSAIPMYKMAQKANHSSPIWAWIPILNTVQMIQISKVSLWVMILYFIPYVNIVVAFYILYNLLKSFGQTNVVMILLCLFIPIIPYYIIAFNDDIKYVY